MSYERELAVARDAASAAAEILERYYETDLEIREKSKGNPVTEADLESDHAIAGLLRASFPQDGLLSEETIHDAARTEKRRAWIIDPMDGTKEFTRRIPEFGVSIALVEDGEPVVAVIQNPPAGVAVWATRGGGTFRNGERVRVSACTELSRAVVIASRTEISKNKFAPYEGWFTEIRPVGSIAWKLACIACADGDLNVSVAPKNEWDVVAGDLLVREAGGIYVAFDGSRRTYNQRHTLIDASMAAGPPTLVEAFLARERARAAG